MIDPELWGKYLDYLDRKNEEQEAMVRKTNEETRAKEEKIKKEYDIRYEKRYEMCIKARDAYREYFAKPWYRRLFEAEPDYPTMPSSYPIYVPSLPILRLVKDEPTITGFYTWLAREYKS